MGTQQSPAAEPSSPASASTRLVREVNLRAVLHEMWDADAVTGSDLMAATGLTRATVHGVCEELARRGWIAEVANQREHGGYRMGRPARRYAFRPAAGVVVGVDAGQHRVLATVADLRGRTLARRERRFGRREPAAAERLDLIGETVTAALAAAAAPSDRVLVVTVAVPAPVDAEGRTRGTVNPFWERMNPDIATRLAERHGWTVRVDNDANVAALAEGWRGAGRGLANYVTLLTGDALGAGVVEGGRLLRGARGGAGEMRFLELVEGVGSPAGITALSRDWARAALRDPAAHPGSRLRAAGPRGVDAEAVFAAAAAGDPLGVAVVERLGERLARIVGALAVLLDTECVVLAGGSARAHELVLPIVERALPRYVHPPLPRVVASRLGADAISVGTVGQSIEHVREHALGIALPVAAAR